ncbi:hypothetical protein F4678DRAFT_484136 [Xylaria arbuscula]|nr:hypothetical protein F4678DRAFT_484136 [Xylaria arbuscula]
MDDDDSGECQITITDQADIESGSLSSCAKDDLIQISIRNATGVLNFTALTEAFTIEISDSPQLQVLDFPVLQTLDGLLSNEATNLSSISLRQLTSPAPDIYPGGYNATGLGALILRDVPTLDFDNPNITSAVIVESDDCFNLPALVSAGNIHLIGSVVENCFGLEKLASVQNFTLTNITPSVITFGQAVLAVTDTLVVESSVVDPSAYEYTLELDPVASIGGGGFVTSNANLHINLGNLNSVKGNLSVNNNQNCTFNFDQLEEVDSLLVMDNPNTSLPSFPSLLRANTIHLRGYINDSNVFPALVRVADTVTIEAWNDDFNCSKLLSQYQASTINKLSCNGTDNVTETENGDPTSSPSSQSLDDVLSEAPRSRRGLSQKASASPTDGSSDTADNTKQEFGHQGINQGSSCDQTYEVDGQIPIRQVDGRMIIHENPGNELYELPSSLGAGLPEVPQFQSKTAENGTRIEDVSGDRD